MINIQQIAPIIAAFATSGGIIFQIGKHSEKLDMIGLRVEAQEKKDEVVDHSIYEMISGIEILKNDITNIKEDIRDIKVYMEKNR